MAHYYEKTATTKGLVAPPTDIAAVLTVIVRRGDENQTRELSKGWGDWIFAKQPSSGPSSARADLSGAPLSEDQLARAQGDAKTRLQTGTRRPAHWPPKATASEEDE
jgi:hypothetical protein